MWVLLCIILIPAGLLWYSLKEASKTVDVKGKSVFISGCDSGMGHALALRLDKQGLKVFAGCLTKEGAKELRSKSSTLFTIVCDNIITNEADVENAVKIVESGSANGLYALFNNAGVGYGGEWEWFPMKYVRRIMEVNYFGHVAVTRAFLPLLKQAKGRIVNTISAGGIISLAGVGPYCSSKFAMEAFSDSLRLEMKKWGVSVYVIEPGLTDTPMATNGVPMMTIWGEVEEKYKEIYGEDYARSMHTLKLPNMDTVDRVVDIMQDKITKKYPRLRSPVGIVPEIGIIMHNLLPTSWFDAILTQQDRLPIPALLKKK